MGIDPEANFIDPLIALTMVAANTKTLKLGTGVNILSQTNPLLLAKQAASLDMLSNGRLLLGLGIGWLREEFDAMGTPFEKRGARYDDYVTAMKKVWSGDIVEHQSEFLNWTGFKSYPLPSQKPHMPVIIGGKTGKVFQRIAKLGDGWYLPVHDPKEVPELLTALREACDAEGRAMEEIELTAMYNPKSGMDGIKAFQDCGVSRLTIQLMSLGADPAAGIKKFGDEIISKL
jgi:probable F420-dependent oxidoreductase